MTHRPLDRSDREWFHFLGIATMSLAASLAIVLFATLGVTLAGDLVSAAFVEHRTATTLAGVVLVWTPIAFVTMRRRLAARIARGELSSGFDSTRGSAALCLCAALSAAVGIWTQDGALAGVQGSGSTFLWVVAHATLAWFAMRALHAFPAVTGDAPPTDPPGARASERAEDARARNRRKQRHR